MGLAVSNLPLRRDAAVGLEGAWVSGISRSHSASIFSATISISRCGNDGKCESSCLVRSDRKFMSERAFMVTYIDE